MTLPASELSDHPLLSHIPVWAREEPDFQALLESVEARGLDYPVLIDSRQQVVDGRNRRNVLRVLGRPVWCRVIDDAEVAQVVVASLANRRHLTLGARAYLVAPLLQPAVDEARARKLAALKRGDLPSSSEKTTGSSVEELAVMLGFGRNLLFQALDLHKRFSERPDLREQFEPKVLTGELGLGGAIQAIAGKLSTEDKKKHTRALDALLLRGFKDLRTRFRRWDNLDDDRRAKVTATVVTSTAEWPEDVVRATATAWRKAGRI